MVAETDTLFIIGQIATLLFSLAGVVFSADMMVTGVVQLAKRLQVSTAVVGLTVVAIGTSLPELAASVAAALSNHPEIALGNVIGSNICNIGLIIALPAVFYPISCSDKLIRQEGYQMVFVSISIWGLGYYLGELNFALGIVMVLTFCFYIYWVFRNSDKIQEEGKQALADESPEQVYKTRPSRQTQAEAQNFRVAAVKAKPKGPEDIELREDIHEISITFFKIIVSLALLIISSEFLVGSTVELAKIAEVPESVIALSLIAFGTSLPELFGINCCCKKRGR